MAVSYKDPTYDVLDAQVTKELGLPSGLLSGIRLRGERSNADQVSSAGAKSVYQITPTTRDLFLKKYGVDAYASPADAAKVAGLHLKESLQRNNGDASAAAREYVGGTNPANYGPVTAAYVERVTGKQSERKAPSGRNLLEGVDIKALQKQVVAEKKQPAKPTGGIGRDLMQALSLGTRDVIEGAAQGAGFFVDPFIQAAGAGVRAVTGGDYQPATIAGTGKGIADVLGLATPETERQKLQSQIIHGATGAVSGAGAAGQLAKVATSPVARAVLTDMAAAPITQAAAGAGAAGASEQARQEGAGVPAQLAAGLLGGVGGAVGVQRAAQAARQVGMLPPSAVAPKAPQSGIAGRVTPPQQPIPPIGQDAESIASMAAKAAQKGEGSRAASMLAQQVDADPRKVRAAVNLGIADSMQADQVSRNQSFREVAQLLKSQTGSAARRQEIEGLERITARANKIIDDAGGTADLSTLNQNVKDSLASTYNQLKAVARGKYEKIRNQVGGDTPVTAPSFEAYIEQRIEDVGGAKFLEPVEQSLLNRLKADSKPTYARLDDAVKQINAAMADTFGKSKFSDAGSYRLQAIKDALEPDRAAFMERVGLADSYAAANLATVAYKNAQDRQIELFGKQLADSIAPKISAAATAATKGDISKINKLFANAPKDMHGQIAASALRTLFKGKSDIMSFTQFATAFDGLKSNREAYRVLMGKLPASSRREILDLYRVSDGIRKASREFLTTGKALNPAALEIIKKADGLMGTVKRIAMTVAGGTVGSAIGGPVGGVATAAAGAKAAEMMSRNKQQALTLADELLSSPKFFEAATALASGKSGNHPAIKKFNASPEWQQFVQVLPEEQQKAAKIAGIYYLVNQTRESQ